MLLVRLLLSRDSWIDMKYIDARKLPIGQLKHELARAASAA